MKAVILAGGLGTRLEKINADIPKPMTEIHGKPVLLYQLEALKNEGIREFIFVTGHLSEKIEEFFKDGSSFGVRIEYFVEKEPLGTAGALFRLMPEEDFLLCNGDLVFSFSLNQMLHFHQKNNALATLFAHPNSHPYDSTLILRDEESRVTGFLTQEKPHRYENLCNAGIALISPSLLKLYNYKGKADFDRDVIRPAVKTGRIYAYKSFEYVKDMGTPERLRTVAEDIQNKIVQERHRALRQKAVFLDRDGTINEHNGYVTRPEDFFLMPKAAEAIAQINKKGYLAVVVTNQPVIARGDCDEKTLHEIHKRMEVLLGEKGAYTDGIYYCPHHPHKGFENEVEELKISCDCRKPSPGLLLRAKEDFNIDMSLSFMVGDSPTDAQAGERAGCTGILLGKKEEGAAYDDLYEFALKLG